MQQNNLKLDFYKTKKSIYPISDTKTTLIHETNSVRGRPHFLVLLKIKVPELLLLKKVNRCIGYLKNIHSYFLDLSIFIWKTTNIKKGKIKSCSVDKKLISLF